MNDVAKVKELTVAEWLALLARKFPKAFCQPPKPLKIGITNEIRSSKKSWESDPQLGPAIEYWVNQPEYLAACIACVDRIDLQGKPCGMVWPQEADYARNVLQRKVWVNSLRHTQASLSETETEKLLEREK
jgi:ProP effector